MPRMEGRTWERLMIMAPAVRKAEMMGLDSTSHAHPSRSPPRTRYSSATSRDTCAQHSSSSQTQAFRVDC